MTGKELTPLMKQAVQEVAELTAAAATMDDQIVTIRSVVAAYAKIVADLHPLLDSLCEKVSVPWETVYPIAYRLDAADAVAPPFVALRWQEGWADIRVLDGDICVDPQLQNYAIDTELFRVKHQDNGRTDVSVILRDGLLLRALPSIVSSMRYLKELLRGKDDDLAKLWEMLRSLVAS